MRLAIAAAVGFGFAFATPMASYGSDAATLLHGHRGHMHHVVSRPVDPTMTAIVPEASALRHEDTDGLSRNTSDCNRGCIDY